MAAPDLQTARGGAIEPAVRVSTLELFFDLVFVFTLTQLTDVLAHDMDVGHAGQVLVMLGVIWWMYSGYAWLTNAVAPSSTTRRTLLLTGMAGFLVIAVAIPGAFHGDGWAFGAAYMLVSLVHSVLFIRASNMRAAQAMRRLAPLNFLSALLVLVGGIATGPVRPALWAAALGLQIATPYLHRIGWHSIIAGHFVERHGLVIIIAIGESIVAIGLGFAGVPVDAGTITVAVLGLCIAYYLWWAYFAGDDVRAEHALDAITDPLRKARVALRGWGYAHYLLIAGIVALAAGVKKAAGHAFEPLDWAPAIATRRGSGALPRRPRVVPPDTADSGCPLPRCRRGRRPRHDPARPCRRGRPTRSHPADHCRSPDRRRPPRRTTGREHGHPHLRPYRARSQGTSRRLRPRLRINYAVLMCGPA